MKSSIKNQFRELIANACRRNTEGKTVEIATLDLQLSRIARPAVDLAYFMGSSLSPKLRKEETENLLGFYHKKLHDKLAALGYKDELYPMADLKADLKECLPFRYVLSVMHAMVIRMLYFGPILC